MKRLGIDIGSLYIGSVLLEQDKILATDYREHRGSIEQALCGLIKQPKFQNYDRIGITGSFSDPREHVLDNTLATIEGVKFLLPESRNVFVVGGQSFFLILLDSKGEYKEHSINPPCASGTGSFIEQQARRLKIEVKELSERALLYQGKSPGIATRCAVFAKTDIIHAMQEGYSLDAICAGLCEGIARNVVDILVKGRELSSPIGFVGGVSLNTRIVTAMQDILGKKIIVPAHSHLVGAIGAALLGQDKTLNIEKIVSKEYIHREVRSPLKIKLTDYPNFEEFNIHTFQDVEVFLSSHTQELDTKVFLGIDIGSTSTKALLISEHREILGGFYTTTRGDPIQAVQRLIRAIRHTFSDNPFQILGVGTTGSGRKMIKELFRADMEVNEITAHARAAVYLNPEVDTILEIGGQDAKFIRIRNGDVYYSNMNYVCAAGTGSFIEEQAKRLGVSLKDFARMAFQASAPYTSDRCTVYMERDISILLSEGWSKESLAAAVLHSVRDNYLAKVVGKSPLGNHIVFQGATARNPALVACFEETLQKPIHVSPYCHLMGALGVALLCQEKGISSSHFLWDLQNIKVENEICTLCSNHCLLTVVEKEGVKTGWGMKCGREYESKQLKQTIPSAPEKRWQDTMSPLFSIKKSSTKKITIGIPGALYNIEYLPLWYSFLTQIGFQVFLPKASRNTLAQGKAIVNSDYCTPMILAHGYIKTLLPKVDYIFYPAIVNEQYSTQEKELSFRKKTSDAYFCYYSQYLATIVSKLTSLEVESKLISPLIFFHHKTPLEISRAIYQEMKRFFPYLSLEQVEKAFQHAWTEFQKARERLSHSYQNRSPHIPEDKIQIALLGRPYLVFEPMIHLNLLQKIEEKGGEIFWQDEFQLKGYELKYANKYYQRMHWHYGKKIIQLAEYCARSSHLFVIYLTSFRCSPDSFLLSYVKDIMTYYEKPYLVIQLDEHSSDVGYTTRIEAALYSFKNYKKKSPTKISPVTFPRDDRPAKGDTVLIPYIDELIGEFWVASFQSEGYQAFLLEPDAKSLNIGYQYASGGECMPLVSIVGSAIEKVRKQKLNPHTTFLYMPTVCMACNFPQFPIFADMAFQNAKLEGLKIALINNMAPGDVLPSTISNKIFESYIVACILHKLYNRIRPYELEKGKTQAVLKQLKQQVKETLQQGHKIRPILPQIVSQFQTIERDESKGRKPRIGLLGDLYVKFNKVVNQNVQTLVEELGGELILPSMTEYPLHFYDADMRLYGGDPRHYQALHNIEKRYEKAVGSLLEDQLEPNFARCVELMNEYKIRHYLPGETSINVGRALYYIQEQCVDAIIHVNPMFCCPGVVTASIYRKIQEDFGIPIIDIFYDGTGNPNRVLIPHLHYLNKNKKT